MKNDSLPSGWARAPLNDRSYFELIMGQSPPGETYNERGEGLPFFQGKADFGELHPTPRVFCSAPSRFARPDDVLISVRAPVGPTNLADRECSIGRGLAAIRCKSGVSPRYLLMVLRCLESEVAHLADGQGGGFTCLRKEQLADFEIPVPPLAEQRRLVARIEALTSLLEQARQARQAALTEAGSSSRSIIAAAFAALSDAPTKKLGDIAGIIGGAGFPEDGPRPESESERVGLLKVSDMNAEGNETLLQRCRLETTLAHARRLRLRVVPCGAVVFPKRGGAIATNKKRTLAISAALDPNMMGVFPLEGSGLTAEFLRWWFESIDLAELQEDGGIPQVNKKHLDPLEIPVPSPAEQRRIVARLDALAARQTELRRLQTETEAELAAFTPALLAKAFRGEL